MDRDQAWEIVCDFDWEIHPNLPDHSTRGETILAERGVSEEIRRAILSHADFTGVPRVSPLEKALFACDELAGFLRACSYVKPGRVAQLGVALDQHISFCIEAMKARAAELALAGGAAI